MEGRDKAKKRREGEWRNSLHETLYHWIWHKDVSSGGLYSQLGCEQGTGLSAEMNQQQLIPGSQGQILILGTPGDKEVDFSSFCESLLTQDIL